MLRLILIVTWLDSRAFAGDLDWMCSYPAPLPAEEHMQEKELDPERYPKGEDTLGRRYVIRIQKDSEGHWMVWQQYLDQPPRHPEE